MSKEVAVRIRERRLEVGKTQTDMAEALGLSQGAYSLLEGGKTSISLKAVLKIGLILDIPTTQLLYGEKPDYSRIEGFMPLVEENSEMEYIKAKNKKHFLSKLEYYKIPGFEHGEYRMFCVTQQNMNPLLLENDTVICERTSIDKIKESSIKLIVTDNGIRIYRVFKGESDDVLTLKSDNRDFEEIRMKSSDILEVWSVCSKITNGFDSVIISDKNRISDLEDDLKSLKKSVVEITEGIAKVK